MRPGNPTKINMTILSILAGASGIMMALANVPQAIKIFHYKSAGDIAIPTPIMLLIGSIIWSLYGIEIQNWNIIAANSIGTITLSTVIIGWILYHKNHKK